MRIPTEWNTIRKIISNATRPHHRFALTCFWWSFHCSILSCIASSISVNLATFCVRYNPSWSPLSPESSGQTLWWIRHLTQSLSWLGVSTFAFPLILSSLYNLFVFLYNHTAVKTTFFIRLVLKRFPLRSFLMRICHHLASATTLTL